MGLNWSTYFMYFSAGTAGDECDCYKNACTPAGGGAGNPGTGLTTATNLGVYTGAYPNKNDGFGPAWPNIGSDGCLVSGGKFTMSNVSFPVGGTYYMCISQPTSTQLQFKGKAVHSESGSPVTITIVDTTATTTTGTTTGTTATTTGTTATSPAHKAEVTAFIAMLTGIAAVALML